MYYRRTSAVSSAIAGVAIIVVLVVAGAAGYYVGMSGAHGTATTSTVTVGGSTVTSTVGAGATVTSVSTSTVTASGSNSGGASGSLVQQAEAECANSNPCLTIYNTLDTNTWNQYFAPTFYAAYPFFQGKVNFVALPGAQETSRALSEFQTNKVQADVYETTLPLLYPILLAGGVQNYTDPVVQLGNFSAGSYDPNGAWVGVFYSVSVVAYNTKLVSASQLPANFSTPQTAFAALGNSAFSGKVVIQSPDPLSTVGGPFYWLYTQMGNSSWTSLMNSIVANHPIITTSGGQTSSDLVAGTGSIGVIGYNDVVGARAQGQPLGMIINNPLLYVPSTIAIAKGAPHPAAGELLEQWWTSYAGMAATAASGRAPIYTSLGLQYKLVPPGVTFTNEFTNPVALSNTGMWADTFKGIFGA